MDSGHGLTRITRITRKSTTRIRAIRVYPWPVLSAASELEVTPTVPRQNLNSELEVQTVGIRSRSDLKKRISPRNPTLSLNNPMIPAPASNPKSVVDTSRRTHRCPSTLDLDQSYATRRIGTHAHRRPPMTEVAHEGRDVAVSAQIEIAIVGGNPEEIRRIAEVDLEADDAGRPSGERRTVVELALELFLEIFAEAADVGAAAERGADKWCEQPVGGRGGGRRRRLRRLMRP